MRVLWEHGPSTVSRIREVLLPETDLAYNSISTTIRILEDKGLVSHVKDGRAHVYEATMVQDEAKGQALEFVLDRFFEDSPLDLISRLVGKGSLSDDERREIKKLLNDDEDGGRDQ